MSIAAFISFLLFTAYTPGPNNILAMSTAARHGFRKTMPLCLGMMAGFCIVLGGCAVFSSMLFEAAPVVEPVMRVLGAAYIAWLGWHIYHDKGDGGEKDEAGATGFVSGLFLQCINIKLILFGLTSMATFILPFYSRFYEVLLFTAILVAVSSSSNFLWALFGSAFQGLFARHGRVLNACMAILLLWCAVRMVVV